jgi:hypothetical protein
VRTREREEARPDHLELEGERAVARHKEADEGAQVRLVADQGDARALGEGLQAAEQGVRAAVGL